MAKLAPITFEELAARKEAARRADDIAIAQGRKSAAQVKLESEFFAFGPDRATLILAPQPRLADEYDADWHA